MHLYILICVYNFYARKRFGGICVHVEYNIACWGPSLPLHQDTVARKLVLTLLKLELIDFIASCHYIANKLFFVLSISSNLLHKIK